MKEPRTNIDWGKHEVTKTEFEGVLIHKIAKPDTRCRSVVFINTQGILAVTGDYGNWIFCREFHPSKDGFVSDSYWCEKLRIGSTQKPSDFDSDGTEKEIRKMLKEEDISNEDKEYLKDIIGEVNECEERYMVYAYDNLPKDRDPEYIPIIKKLNPWLECIFDAFEEICKREVN